MPGHASLDLKIKRLTAIEAEYRHAIKRAEGDLHRDPENRKKYERLLEKNRRKAEKLLPKIRRARELRASRR